MGTASTTAPGALGTILSVWAHPDDETFLAGGVMAAARDRGQRVVCASATAGERGTSDPATWPAERLGRVRRWEAAAAMTVLGVEEHHVYDLPDGGLADHEEAGLRWVGGLLAEVRPDTILTFGPEGMTYHPDHIAVHEWVTRAWDGAGRRGRLMYAAPMAERLERFSDFYETRNVYMSDERPTGVATADLTLHLCLDGPDLDRKFAALRAMATQTAELVAAVDHDVLLPLIADEGFIDATAGAGHRRVPMSTASFRVIAGPTDLPLAHLNLTVADLERSIDFYCRWFAFTDPPRRYPDGTAFLGNADGFDLAFHPGTPPSPPAPTVHFGFRSPSPEAVRHLRDSLVTSGATITETHDTDAYVGFKCLDPDGYEIEVYWEPAHGDRK